MAEKKQLSYAITVDFLYELIEEAENQVAILKLLLEGFLQGSHGSHDLMEIAIEILWANNSLEKKSFCSRRQACPRFNN
jgi:hypothetical protein